MRGVLRHPRTPLAVLLALVAIWVVVLARLAMLRHQHYGTFDFDAGIYDQYLWNIARFRTGNTVRGVSFFAHHASPLLLLIAPLSWVGAGPPVWDALHAAALGATAVALYALAVDKLGNRWVGLAAGVVWLLNPTVQWLVHEGFHPDGMAVPFLVCTYLFGERWRARHAARLASAAAGRDVTPVAASDGGPVAVVPEPAPAATATATATAVATETTSPAESSPVRRDRTGWWLAASFLLAIGWKEDVALALVGMAVVWLVRREWVLGLRVLSAAGLWFVVFGMWMVPTLAGGSVFGGIYDLGTTPGEIVETAVRDPSRVVDKLHENDAAGYARGLLEPYGFVPLLSPLTLLIGLPQWFTNIISASSFTWNLHFHYQAIPSAALGISMVEGLRRAYSLRRPIGPAVLAVALVSALLSSRMYGPSPIGVDYRRGIWPLDPPSTFEEREAALDRIPAGAGVSADYLLVPHLTHREVIYTFPNPWEPQNYGVIPGTTGEPADVDWIVVDRAVLGTGQLELLQQIEDSGEFRPRFDRDGVVLLERVAPPTGRVGD